MSNCRTTPRDHESTSQQCCRRICSLLRLCLVSVSAPVFVDHLLVRMAVARMETCEDVGELARELGVRPRCLYKWRRKLEMVEPGQEASRPSTHASAHRKEIYRLKQLMAEKTLEVDFFKGALQEIEARRQRNSGSGEMASTTRSEK